MTEVPDYLLQRSAERRAALGLTSGDAAAGGGDGGAVVPAGDAAPAAAAAATPAPAPTPEIEKVEPPKPITPWVQAANERKRVPMWMAPVALFIPIWLFMVVGTLEEPTRAAEGPVAIGGEIYSTCAGCHGAGGGGGVGQALNGGEVIATFPNVEDHVAWVLNGSPGAGTPYGNPDRPGGQRISATQMPAQELSSVEVMEVVLYERVVHGGVSEGDLEAWIHFVEEADLPEWDSTVLPQEIKGAFLEYLDSHPEMAEKCEETNCLGEA